MNKYQKLLIWNSLCPQAGAPGAALLRAALWRRGGRGAGGGGAAERAANTDTGRRLPAVGRCAGPHLESRAGPDGAAAAAGQQADGGDRRAAAGACALAGVSAFPACPCLHAFPFACTCHVQCLVLCEPHHTIFHHTSGTVRWMLTID